MFGGAIVGLLVYVEVAWTERGLRLSLQRRKLRVRGDCGFGYKQFFHNNKYARALTFTFTCTYFCFANRCHSFKAVEAFHLPTSHNILPIAAGLRELLSRSICQAAGLLISLKQTVMLHRHSLAFNMAR